MKHWTPSKIAQLATSIESRAHEIDGMIWHFNRYGAVSAEHERAYIKDLKSKASSLRVDIEAFKALDIEEMLAEIE